MEWKNLDTLPEDGKDIWVLNFEYGFSGNDPLCQKRSLVIRNATFNRMNGWCLYECKQPYVKYWCYPTPIKDMPETWGEKVKDV